MEIGQDYLSFLNVAAAEQLSNHLHDTQRERRYWVFVGLLAQTAYRLEEGCSVGAEQVELQL